MLSLQSKGLHFVDPLNVENTRSAVMAFLDDEYANKKAIEASQVQLPTWKSFAESVLGWIQE